jgi:hypothetical protein
MLTTGPAPHRVTRISKHALTSFFSAPRTKGAKGAALGGSFADSVHGLTYERS